jgi:hypothetical protein
VGIRLASPAVGRAGAVPTVRVSARVAVVVVGVPVREGLLVECDLLKGCVRTGEPAEGSDGWGEYYR